MADTDQQPENVTPNPPKEFYKIINDFLADIVLTFPEYSGVIGRWWNRENTEESREKETLFVFKHCVKVFPERFFDILYKNADIFNPDSEIRTDFLPGIVFNQLWNLDISDNTKETMWKYLQLILFSVIGSVNNTADLGDTAKLFEFINEEELKTKLEETLENMQNLFDASGSDVHDNDSSFNNINMQNIPNAEQLQSHLNSMLGGKLGKLALELAEETAKDLNLDMENDSNAKDVFQKLFKNPGKMMNMVKNIGGKLENKIKSGEISETEIMQEGMDMLDKMKNMPGMGDMKKVFTQMGMPGLGKGGKINLGAMEAQLSKNMKSAQLKERLRNKAQANAKARQENTNNTNSSQNYTPMMSEEELIKIFSTGENVEKTPRGAKPPRKSNKKKKNKNKK